MGITLVPAYGRDYKSQAAVKADWDANKDFLIQSIGHPYDGSYINKEDAEKTPLVLKYNIRYNKLTQICVIKVKKVAVAKNKS